MADTYTQITLFPGYRVRSPDETQIVDHDVRSQEDIRHQTVGDIPAVSPNKALFLYLFERWHIDEDTLHGVGRSCIVTHDRSWNILLPA